jgi:tetratricopeptide (TPR) repeat protein
MVRLDTKFTQMRILFILISIFPFLLFSQEKYFNIDEVQFETQIEENLIRKILNGEEASVASFFSISPKDSLYFEVWSARFEKEIEELKVRKIPKKLEKDVEKIYESIHAKFLKKYENEAYFDQIFEKGVYNCVTAVGLYALTFRELGIPYTIKETPSHVYIVADPENTQLLIETTDPISGFKTFSPGFKENFVSQLGMMKLIDENDINSKGIYGVFDEHYFGGDDLTIEELVGIQYYNKGVFSLMENDFQSGIKALSKAQLFYSNKQLDELMLVSMVGILSSSDYKEWQDIRILPYLSRFESQNITRTNVNGEFNRMLNAVLIERNDVETAEKAYQHFITASNNQEINTEVSFSYYFEKAVIDYNRAYYRNSFDNIIMAYTYKPGHARAENLIGESFSLAFRNKSYDEALSTLDTIMAQNSELKKNNKLNTMRLNLYLAKMGDDFDSKKATSGNQMMALFEETVDGNSDYLYDENILGNAYSKAAVYYFRKGYSSKARSIVQAGLNYAPNNYELKSRLRMLNQ